MRSAFIAPEAVYASHLASLSGDLLTRIGGVVPLRSFMRHYTNISVGKLADYTGIPAETVHSTLVSMKLRAALPPIGASASIYSASASSGPSTEASGASASSSSAAAAAAAAGGAGADTLHFYLSNDTVSVEESRVGFNVTGFFIRGIEQMTRVAHSEGHAVSGGGRSGGRPAGATPAGGRGHAGGR